MTLKLKSTRNELWKRLKPGMVSSFHPHGMCKKVGMVMAKTGCTSCTNWTIFFEVSGFRTKTHLLHRQFKILITYYNSGLFCIQHATFKATSSTCNPFWHNLLFLMHLLICFELIALKLKSSTNELWKGWNLAWYHHFTRIACAKK